VHVEVALHGRRVEMAGGGAATCGERGDEATAHAFGLVGWYCSTGPGHAAVGRRGLLASGPITDSFSKFSKPAQTL
jgi:hypothetical protein